MAAEVTIRADQKTFEHFARALDREAGSRAMLRDAADSIEDAISPATQQARGAILAMRSAGLPHGGEPLRAAIAAGVDEHVVLKPRSAGVKVVASSKGMPRWFTQAPKRTNARRGWTHPVYGRTGVLVRQIGAPGWFDDTLARHAPAARRAVVDAMHDSAKRIERG
ncbi:hypothetical protein Val02_82110 [Virgisporangium aliadipatigenens]|uniref:Uncharacterized protein n=1 Tax=Virgisporangium aliadipatigenens TaxID=741659 RepID=A0A8J4DUH8_9ACTN|nr:hypothetical protein [Virgisporangium aliadipatigenens]GIJ51325.1 hypothetical protein Val02_82110 [Virgisporangium aliadipatigenens]